MAAEVSELGIRGLLADYRSGARSPVEVLRAAHARAEQCDQPVWITLLDWDVVAEYLARLGEPSAERPLYGIPFAIKDNIDLAGALTTAACPAFGYLPARSAFVVLALIGAGAIPLGKTNMDQFATGLVGTRTPYGACGSVLDGRYVSGGSSSGSAVAVAAGLVSFALGTDTAGSGRVPAAFNAIVGLKPSFGLLSTAGVVPACRTLDCVSIFTRDVADARLVFAAAGGADPADPYSRPARPRPGPDPQPPGIGVPRVGVPRAGQLDFFGDGQAAAAWAAALARGQALGFELVEIDLAPYLAAARLLYEGAWVAERTAAVGDFVAGHPQDVDPVVGAIIAGGERPSAVDAFRGAYRLAELRRRSAPDWERVDAMLLPTAPTIYTHEEIASDPVGCNAILGTYTNFVNLMELCAVAVPAGPRGDGLPFGVSLIAPRDADDLVLRLAATSLGEDAAPPPAPAAAPAPAPAPSDSALVAVVGAHLSGQPLNRELTELGARLERLTRTAPVYRLYALAGGGPPKPGLVRAGGEDGRAIEVEVWRIAQAALGHLVAGVRPPLSIGAVELAGGSTVPGFVCDSGVAQSSREITAWGGWRAFLAAESPVLAS